MEAKKQVTKGYKYITPKQWEKTVPNLQPNDLIRYSVNNEFRSGGFLKRNCWPKYLVLINYSNKASWCVQLNQPTLKLWVRTKKVRDQAKKDAGVK